MKSTLSVHDQQLIEISKVARKGGRAPLPQPLAGHFLLQRAVAHLGQCGGHIARLQHWRWRDRAGQAVQARSCNVDSWGLVLLERRGHKASFPSRQVETDRARSGTNVVHTRTRRPRPQVLDGGRGRPRCLVRSKTAGSLLFRTGIGAGVDRCRPRKCAGGFRKAHQVRSDRSVDCPSGGARRIRPDSTPPNSSLPHHRQDPFPIPQRLGTALLRSSGNRFPPGKTVRAPSREKAKLAAVSVRKRTVISSQDVMQSTPSQLFPEPPAPWVRATCATSRVSAGGTSVSSRRSTATRVRRARQHEPLTSRRSCSTNSLRSIDTRSSGDANRKWRRGLFPHRPRQR